ncbi:MAG: fenitrothion hydrolase [Solirubrobacteraceae bacterium]
MSPRRAVVAVGVTIGGGLVLASPATAHGLTGNQDLPIPQWMFAWAAAIVLVLSFIGLAALAPRSVLRDGVYERHLTGPVPVPIQVAGGTLGVLLYTGLIYAGLVGTDEPQQNIVPTFVYVVFWVAVPLLSALIGDVFALFNPWRAIGRATGWLVQRLRTDGAPSPLAWPARLGAWPAIVALVAFGWVELVLPERDDPRTLALLGLIYGIVQLVGMALYGTREWNRRGDGFAVYFALCAALSPLRWGREGLRLRAPLAGTVRLRAERTLVPLVCTLIGITTFDGLGEGSLWRPVSETLAEPLEALGLGWRPISMITGTIGLLATLGLVGLLYLAGCRGMARAGRGVDTRRLAEAFAHTLIPIALAYVLAHYVGLLAYQGQALGYLASDPLGDGTDLLGTASTRIDYSWISGNTIWYIQVAALITGHVASLWLAHDGALAMFSSPRRAMRSQGSMLAVMVALTGLGLFLIS